MEKKRIFIAINLENEIKNYLSVIQNTINLTNSKIKWVNKRNLHITLNFLGYQSLAQIEQTTKILEGITPFHNSFIVGLSSMIGFFSSHKTPRTIWIGIEKGSDNLKKIYDDLRYSLSRENLSRENNKFSSHITIGRVKYIYDKKYFMDILKNIDIKKMSQKIKSIELMESNLTSTGPIYSIVNSFSFDDK
ncbi:MAG: RNA 2',3'-cyclic phosphodiesterase [Candidatus Caldatribacteriota bacterium]|nr:RNA 2',3'-cyclic phosphodiesterase [Candidatus Caldatribacteriota bacterium]